MEPASPFHVWLLTLKGALSGHAQRAQLVETAL